MSGGTSPYTYAWTASGGGIVPGGQAGNQDLTGLVAGTYNVVVTDANSCTTTRSVVITQPAAALSTTETHVDVLCFGGATGSIDLTVNGGTPVYTYVWTASAGGVIPGGQANNQDLTGLVAGDYAVVVTDANGCTVSRTVTITQFGILTATVAYTNVTCNGASDGTITISNPAGGSGTYEYSINGGTSWQPGGSYTGLGPATRNVRIRDAADPSCFIVLEPALVITQPAVLSATVVIQTLPVRCKRRYYNDHQPTGRIWNLRIQHRWWHQLAIKRKLYDTCSCYL